MLSYMIVMLKTVGFTIVEVLLVTVILASLATIGVVSYTATQKRAANSVVLASVDHGSEVLEIQFTRQRDYPPNFAGTEFVPSDGVVTALWTNAPQVRIHKNLTPEQNAQLFLNACNANMPVVSGGTTYNTACAFAGINLHVKGKKGSNVIFHGPEVTKAEVATEMTCAVPDCQAAALAIIEQFEAQGGTWPIRVSGGQVTLPDPELVTTGVATKFCLEGRSDRYLDVVAHIKSGETSPQSGPCPDDPELHYP